MLEKIVRFLSRSEVQAPTKEPYHTNHAAKIEWQPLDPSRLNLTSKRLREIEASMAESTRAEFAAVTRELNQNQRSGNN